MARLAGGHDAALNDLMDRHAERLFHYLVRSLQNEEDAADLAQETFARVCRNRAKFDPNQKFTTWLYAIASNLVRDRYRWRSRHPRVSLEAQDERAGPASMTAFVLQNHLLTSGCKPKSERMPCAGPSPRSRKNCGNRSFWPCTRTCRRLKSPPFSTVPSRPSKPASTARGNNCAWSWRRWCKRHERILIRF